MSKTERTFVMIKPDGVQRGLIGTIIQRFERKGLKLVALKLILASKPLLEKHYAHLSGKPFFQAHINYMNSCPVVPMVWEGLNAVRAGRMVIGETKPIKSKAGTIRGDLGLDVGRNVIHGSDSVDTAKKEIEMWFGENEIFNWKNTNDMWIYEVV